MVTTKGRRIDDRQRTALMEKLRDGYERTGLTFEEIGVKVGYKRSAAAVMASHYLTGRRVPPLEILPKLARVLKIKLTIEDIGLALGGSSKLEALCSLLKVDKPTIRAIGQGLVRKAKKR